MFFKILKIKVTVKKTIDVSDFRFFTFNVVCLKKAFVGTLFEPISTNLESAKNSAVFDLLKENTFFGHISTFCKI